MIEAGARPAVAVRRGRHTLPPKAALGALRVDADGRVLDGLQGYYWYGEAIVLATDVAEYLLGGASVPHAAVVALAAIVDAKRWRAEREVAEVADDWAARAWGAAVHESSLVEYAMQRLGELHAWGVYRAALADALAALARRG